MRRKGWFVLAVVFQIVILTVMIGMKWSTLAFGTKILLKTAPVDPWDLFRGDYVTLNYEIMSLDLTTLKTDEIPFASNETVYVSLQQNGKYWEPTAVSHRRPSDGTLAVKGRVNSYDDVYEKKLFVSYGIDSYYVPQHQGRAIELGRAALDAEVSVDSRGNAALSRLFIEGEEVEFQ